jgi:Zn-dependent peptidase ImmA (M78 family)
MEDACNRFAGALLAPRSEVVEQLGETRNELEPRELYRLKHKYGLSMAGWLQRAQELDVISDSTYEDLRRQFDHRGWDENEPGDDYPSQEPSLFEELIYRAYSQDIIGESKAAELLGTSSGEFYRRRTMTEE